MRSKSQSPINVKLILIGFFLVFLLFLVLRSTFSPSPPQQTQSLDHSVAVSNSSSEDQETEDHHQPSSSSSVDCPSTQTCNKISPSLANALVHYATSNVTPQQTLKEISVSLRVLEKKSPCNFLVFGLGHDSLMWTGLNHGGRTVFLEEDKSWIEQIQSQLPSLESYHVIYDTRITQADELMETGMSNQDCKQVIDPGFSKCQLALKGLPQQVLDIDWDLIMVDAPTGWHDGAPGRMSAIYTAGLIARNKEEGETHVFVHDVDRVVEDQFSKAFLCEGYLVEQEGRIRHFNIPSHKAALARPFCP
ncbi:Glucuronoxylan 4-O-methyltransferase 2 [Capsicum chinense]|uniref:Glucuronoxylan 4-O-methyltransferase 2 n=1 Tax=Capsicum annuum TaxID=4072 RepID=A0A1U8EHS4_CAPAN|nr:glucuronoxylan 4-O-methyltransferase 3 [Capsicum annuum]KAF3619918.1 Glucuronoxylan 4-O-methyltransferase 2 [Capsicum annuum]KAF3669611.1 Glucuronoxylan 4-O-methyltransferase 2 [Capsicum annuum]PHT71025.1 Glucuronoxylan 4-O-methyltransferase 2 [Capsicum annuum]PHU05568.1 Glucuronoxylan 4-O-methyltransferase 2 [Capsicum chinense]